MVAERRSKQWWRETVERYRKSGMTAEVFAKTRGVNVSTLRWWVYELGREKRTAGAGQTAIRPESKTCGPAEGSEGIVPLQVDLSRVLAIGERRTPSVVEVLVGDELVVRLFDAGEPAYVAELVRELRAQPC